MRSSRTLASFAVALVLSAPSIASPLTEAVKVSDLKGIAAALAAGESPNQAIDGAGLRPLDIAILQRRDDIVRLLLVHGADLNSGPNEQRASPLLMAAAVGGTEAIKLLLDKGALINATDKAGVTPLAAAAAAGKAAAAYELIIRGANVNVKTSTGNTPLMMAARGGHTDVVTVLVLAGADKNAADDSGKTAAEIVRSLTELNVDSRYGTLAALNLAPQTNQSADNGQAAIPCNDIDEVARRIVHANPGKKIDPEALLGAVRIQQELRGCIAPQPSR